MNGANSAETNIHPDDVDTMDAHPPSSPSPNFIEPQILLKVASRGTDEAHMCRE